MRKICCFAFVLCCLLAVVSNVQAQEFTITELDGGNGLLSPPQPAIGISVPNGDFIVAARPDLTLANITVANNTQLFEVSSGDFISNDTIGSFPSLFGNSALTLNNNLPSIPFGESFIGFATGFPDFPFSTIGYAEVLRTSETLELLSSDFVSTDFTASPDSSFGITVPTPEPSSALIGALGLVAMGLRRRRS